MADQKKLRPRQVAAYQSLRPVMVDESATCGAQIGVNLLLPDGTVGTLAQLVKLFGGTAPAGTSALTTTDDLDEGQWNLWFTNRRAQDAVGGILANSANVTMTYVGATSITADLTSLTDSGTGALLATTFDAKGRKTGSRAATITGTAGRVTVANGSAAAGLPTIDLATVTDAGGGSLLRFVRDAWGRITGTSAATTSDLSEGSNLYYTDTRTDARITVQKGVANGLAPLGSDTKINISYLPAAVLGQVSYQGVWDASTGSPPTTTPSKGWYYIVTVAGSTSLSGITDWKVGDWAIYNGTAWNKVDNTDAISSWNGRTGTVVPASGDYTAAMVGLGNVDNTSDVNKPVSTAQQAALDALIPTGYIDGLKMAWVSGTALTVTTGAAYIPGISKVLRVSSDIAKTGLSLTASTWYHVYLYNNAGTPDVEIVTTAPAAAYSGTARTKTGDTSRRYVGSVLTDASANIYNFIYFDGFIRPLLDTAELPGVFRVLSGGLATVYTTVALSSVIPLTSRLAQLRISNYETSASLRISNSDTGLAMNSGLVGMPPGSPTTAYINFPTNSAQEIQYAFRSAPSGAGCVIDVYGYYVER